MDKELLDLVIKLILIFVSGAATVFFGLCLWFLKKLITSVFDATTEIKLVNASLTRLNEDVKPIPKLKEDVNHFYRRLERLEEKENL